MQYLAWPDHGVPDDSSEFLNFVKQVREARTGEFVITINYCMYFDFLSCMENKICRTSRKRKDRNR